MKRRDFVTGALAAPLAATSVRAAPSGGKPVSTWEALDAAARAGVPVIDATGFTAPQGSELVGREWRDTQIVGGTFNEVTLQGPTNVAFHNTRVLYDQQGRDRREMVFEVRGARNLRFYQPWFRDVRVRPGQVPGQGFGLWIRNSEDVGIHGHTFEGFAVQISTSYVTGLEVTDGEMFHASRDGFNFSNQSGIRIRGNYLHDFYVLGVEHQDFIQVMGHRSPVTDMEIVGNILDMGQGSVGQLMLLQNENIADIGHHRNWHIEGNRIRGGHRHGIRCLGVNGVTIINNLIEAADINFAERYNREHYLAQPWMDGNHDPGSVPRLQVNGSCRNVVLRGNAFAGKPRVMSTRWNGPRLDIPKRIPPDWVVSG